MMTLAEWSNVSDIVTASVAVIALGGAIWQVVVARTSQREATASELYGNYLTLAVEYPMLASGQIPVPEVNGPTNEDFERYEWFVSVMLHAFEQILELTAGDPIWRKAITDQIGYHRKYLASTRFIPGHYSDALCELFPKSDQPKNA